MAATSSVWLARLSTLSDELQCSLVVCSITTARSYELGPQEDVVASLVMMLSGIVAVLAGWVMF